MDFYLAKPIFRPGVSYLLSDSQGVFTYDRITFEVECDSPASEHIQVLCDLLDRGLPVRDLAETFGPFRAHATDLLQAFDRYGFLTESEPPGPTDFITGALLWQEVSALAERARNRVGSRFYDALRNDHVSRGALLRYAVEYYHVVRHGPRIIAGMLAHVTDRRSEGVLEVFLKSELGHDRMLLQTLAAVGISEDQALALGPLPQTFGLIASFQVMADQDPLAFRALAFLLEEASDVFHEAFVSACQSRGLDERFYGPIVRHAAINDDGDHGAISAQLLEPVEVVTTEERIGVARHLGFVIEQLAAMEYAILTNPVEVA